MDIKPYSEMIKSELIVEIEKRGLVDIAKESAKNENKITNAEYVSVLEIDYEDKITKDKQVVISSGKPEATAGTKEESEEEKLAKIEVMVGDMSTIIPVIVTDHDNSVTIKEDVQGRTVGIRWGNPIIGMTTTQIALHGRLQYLPKGAIIRAKKVPLADHVADADGSERSIRDRKRFSISDTTGWGESEFEAHKKEQALKRL